MVYINFTTIKISYLIISSLILAPTGKAMFYKDTYDLVAIPASEYLICNTRQSSCLCTSHLLPVLIKPPSPLGIVGTLTFLDLESLLEAATAGTNSW